LKPNARGDRKNEFPGNAQRQIGLAMIAALAIMATRSLL